MSDWSSYVCSSDLNVGYYISFLPCHGCRTIQARQFPTMDDHGLVHACHHHADAGQHHRQRRAAAHGGRVVRLAQPDHLGAESVLRGGGTRHAGNWLATGAIRALARDTGKTSSGDRVVYNVWISV